ncbi:MAG: hypothetical protein PHG96_01215 [Kiritimatiellae bacterium]|nr:hypothetical protein [Kiritimatiellia bacterium]
MTAVCLPKPSYRYANAASSVLVPPVTRPATVAEVSILAVATFRRVTFFRVLAASSDSVVITVTPSASVVTARATQAGDSPVS